MFWCPYCFPTFFAVTIYYCRTSFPPSRNGFFGISGMRHAFSAPRFIWIGYVRIVLWFFRHAGMVTIQSISKPEHKFQDDDNQEEDHKDPPKHG